MSLHISGPPGSGRARSDPTHQMQRPHQHPHSHSAHQGTLTTQPPPNNAYMSTSTTSMECESPAGPNTRSLQQQQQDALLRQQQQQHLAQLVQGQGGVRWGRQPVTTTVSPQQLLPPTLAQSYLPTVDLPGDLETTTTGSGNMFLTRHQGLAQPNPLPYPTIPQAYHASAASFPFPLANNTPGASGESGGSSGPPRRTGSGDESPMVGVCVQQSPVASH